MALNAPRAARRPSLLRQWRNLISQLTPQERSDAWLGLYGCILVIDAVVLLAAAF